MSKFTIEQARAVYQLYSRGTEPTVEQDLLVALNTVLDSAPEPQSLALQAQTPLSIGLSHTKFPLLSSRRFYGPTHSLRTIDKFFMFIVLTDPHFPSVEFIRRK